MESTGQTYYDVYINRKDECSSLTLFYTLLGNKSENISDISSFLVNHISPKFYGTFSFKKQDIRFKSLREITKTGIDVKLWKDACILFNEESICILHERFEILRDTLIAINAPNNSRCEAEARMMKSDDTYESVDAYCIESLKQTNPQDIYTSKRFVAEEYLGNKRAFEQLNELVEYYSGHCSKIDN